MKDVFHGTSDIHNNAVAVRRYLAIIAAAMLILAGLQGTTVFTVDPFGWLRGTQPVDRYVKDARWRTPGFLLTNHPEIALIGTSMSDNAHEADLSPSDPAKAAILTLRGSATDEQAAVANLLFAGLHHPRLLLWEIHPTTWVRGTTQLPRIQPMPWDLYERPTLRTLATYLLSPSSASETASQLTDLTPLREIQGITAYQEEYQAASLLEALCAPAFEGPFASAATVEDLTRHLITPIVSAHPETQFVFFITSPSTAYYWRLSEENRRAVLDSALAAARILGSFPNASIVDFRGAPWTDDWSVYADTYHHSPEINRIQISMTLAGQRSSVHDIESTNQKIVAAIPKTDERLSRLVAPDCYQRLTSHTAQVQATQHP